MRGSDQKNSFTTALEYNKARPHGRLDRYWWIPPVLVVPIIVMAIFDSISRDRARSAVNNAPFVRSDHLGSVCNTGRLIRTELYTDQFGIGSEHGNDFAYLCLDDYIQVHRRSHSKYFEWRKVSSAPQLLSLFDEKRSFSVKLAEQDMDIEEVPIIFDDYKSKLNDSIVPDSWQKLMAAPDLRYRLRALPCKRRLEVAGTFWRKDDGIHVCRFAYKGIGESEYLALVSIHIR